MTSHSNQVQCYHRHHHNKKQTPSQTGTELTTPERHSSETWRCDSRNLSFPWKWCDIGYTCTWCLLFCAVSVALPCHPHHSSYAPFCSVSGVLSGRGTVTRTRSTAPLPDSPPELSGTTWTSPHSVRGRASWLYHLTCASRACGAWSLPWCWTVRYSCLSYRLRVDLRGRISCVRRAIGDVCSSCYTTHTEVIVCCFECNL